MSLLKTEEGLSTKKKVMLTLIGMVALVIILGIIFLARAVPMATSIDFTSIRNNLSTQGTSARPDSAADTKSLFATGFEESPEQKLLSEQRASFVKEGRARIYVEGALNDYYRENYDEAFRRLERAKSYDPGNFLAARLSAQINLELKKYRRAYADLERAKQIPNEDDTVTRDLDVLRKIIRYTRYEIDNLQRYVHENPSDMLASARLQELNEQMQE